ncbi:hypothetical protein Goshw_023785 [Gossypium schwendimanii]|uniref:Cupin type-1 domain-containing protein n=1 Tax=Gossypium schwendimanii TaxID=34291 RepID=A0A7J9LY52_GOSSC|nr:hypothetical protein [Gossypium schwendimanii]
MNPTLVFFIIILCSTSISICLADNDNLQDACPTNTTVTRMVFINGFPCKNPSSISSADFTTSNLKHAGDTDNFLHSSVNIVTAADFPGLNTLGLSIARTDLDLDGMVMPHSHPRASELFFVHKGIVLAGFIDTNNTLFESLINEGDVFLFPRGLLHFCMNAGYEPAIAFSVMNSQNPGVVSIGGAVFETDKLLIDKIMANFYTISSNWRNKLDSLRDRIGLCYVIKNRISSSDELKVAYGPRGDYSLRDFHHAVNSLPTDSFSPVINESGSISCYGLALSLSRCFDMKLASVLSDQVLYSWGGRDIVRKVIVLSSCLPETIDSALKETLTDAADKCVSVEFILLEQRSNHLSDIRANISTFSRCISDLDNCSFQCCLPALTEIKVFHGLVKRWLQDLRDDMEEPLQAHFIFNSNLAGSVKQISCNLSASVNHIIDGFNPCKSSVKLQQASSPVNFNIIDRTNLRSLSEGLIFGNPYFVTPSASPEIEAASDEMDQLELNAQVFKGLCSALHSMDQGLICSSNCNLETMREATFNCYYILQPSDNGPMLLRRLAGSEEVLPFSDVNRFVAHSVPKEIEISIQSSLSKLESRDYNPVLYDRGFHQKLNLLVKESLQFGCVAPKRNDATCEPNPTNPDSTEVNARPISSVGVMVVFDEMSQLDQTAEERKKPTSIAEEWERLVANEIPVKYSPTKPKSDQSVILLSSPDNSKQLDVNTTRILERLELPRQLKSKQGSPGNNSNRILDVANMSMKKPLIPFQPNQAADQGVTSSQLIRPSFQRLKRKHK